MVYDKVVIVALDFATAQQALKLVDCLDPKLCRLKVGKQLFTVAGPGLVTQLVKRGFDVFLDLKFHDIPTTVELACRAATDLGVWMMNVHAMGGRTMMQAAHRGIGNGISRPLLVAVTVLTSMGAGELGEIGIADTPEFAVLRLAQLAANCGLDGVVCSAQEAPALKALLGASFKLITPGIRPTMAALDDQNRVMTPTAALLAGADYLVIGRPITHAEDPLLALTRIQQEVGLLNSRAF